MIRFIRFKHIKANFAVITEKFSKIEGERIVVVEQQDLHEPG